MHIEAQGQGPDLVLIHGWAMHAGIFAPLTRALSPRFRLHLVDLPGHGFSRDDTHALDPIACARSIAAAVPRAIWLGWSLGGLIAMQAALDVRAMVRGLVLIASSPRFVIGDDWPQGVAANVFAEFGAGLARDYRGTIERFLALEALGSEHAQSELRDLKAQVFARGEPSVSALEQGMRILETADLRADIARIAMPSLWIAGRRDRLINPAAMQWAALQSGGRYLECNSGHAPFLAHPDTLAQAIADFSEGLPA
jgi:pimeloyl-[acyl-carrier protein] methyl ester esterase